MPTPRVIRTLKEECLWLQEWMNPFALLHALDVWIDTYNNHYLHSARGYKLPRRFEQGYPSVTVPRSWPLDTRGAIYIPTRS
jgi:transposase InsO family protein